VHHPDDPAPDPVDFLDWNNFQIFIRNNNNVTWRNFNVVDNAPPAGADPPGFVALPFLIAGAPDQGRVFDLEVVARLPEGAQLLLDLPACLTRRADVLHRQGNGHEAAAGRNGERCDNVLVKGSPRGPNRFTKLHLPAKATFPSRLFVAIPEEHREHAFEVYARQLHEGREVGRVTWHLAPRRDEM
jgi:serine protease